MVLSSGLRRLASLGAVFALLTGCQAIVPSADAGPLTCTRERAVGPNDECDRDQVCIQGLCRQCTPLTCAGGAGGDGSGGSAAGDDSEGGQGGDDAGGSDGGTSAGGKGGKGGAAGNLAGGGGDGPGGSDGGDGGTAGSSAGGTDGGVSGEGGADAGMSGTSGQGPGGAGQAGATAGGAGTTAGSAGSAGAAPTVAKLGEDCTADNVNCEGDLLCAPLSGWNINNPKFVCTQACCQSNECGVAGSRSLCMPTKFGGGLCLPASYVPARSPNPGEALAGDACTNQSDCRSGLCKDKVCQDLCCADKSGCGGLVCTATREAATSLDTFMCQPSGPGNGASDAACTKDSDCVSGLCLLQLDAKRHCAQPCRRDDDCPANFPNIYNCDYTTITAYNVKLRACFLAKPGGACASANDCGSGDSCSALNDSHLLYCQ